MEFNKHTGGSIFELKVINQKTNKVVARKEFHNTYVPSFKIPLDFFRDILFYGKYIVEPGSYDLYLYVKGLEEPLAVANGLEITKGQVLEFDATI